MNRNRELPKGYSPDAMEEKWYAAWMQRGLFDAEVDPSRPAFSIVIPPPNVTGSLHMGHAFNNTFQDILCRTRRMQGFNVLWLPGTDHAGIDLSFLQRCLQTLPYFYAFPSDLFHAGALSQIFQMCICHSVRTFYDILVYEILHLLI